MGCRSSKEEKMVKQLNKIMINLEPIMTNQLDRIRETYEKTQQNNDVYKLNNQLNEMMISQGTRNNADIEKRNIEFVPEPA